MTLSPFLAGDAPAMSWLIMELGDHLFRREASPMVAALTRIFGVHNLALAEDVVQDAFCRVGSVALPQHAGQSVCVAH